MSASSSAPDTIALCTTTDTFTDVGNGYKVCSGSAGDGATQPDIPNSESTRSLEYLSFYNNLISNPANACIEQGVPQSSAPGMGAGATAPPPFITSTGCCSRAEAWAGPTSTGTPAASAANLSRVTRTTPFTTASAVGAFDDAGLQAGVPPDLLGLTKVWGVSPAHWVHGGTHADNVGVWKGDAAGHPFNVKFAGKTWTQTCMLWCRMTGDTYDPAQDPWAAVYPAPAGSYISAFHALSDKACAFCDATLCARQVVLPDPSAPACPASPSGVACINPFMEVCNQYTLTTAIMEDPTASLPGPASSAPSPPGAAAAPDASWIHSGAAQSAVSGFVKVDQKTSTVIAPNPGATYASTTDPNDLTGPSNGYSDPHGRVGGCFVTRDLYGPGKFSMLVAAPPTMPSPFDTNLQVPGFPAIDPKTGNYPYTGPDAVPGGRGYVLSMWTFSYSEVYGVPPEDSANDASTAFPMNGTVSGTGASSGVPAAPDGIQYTNVVVEGADVITGTANNIGVKQPILAGMANLDAGAAIHNHEIDIEIPSNTDCYAGPDMPSKTGMNTANFNTWLSDTDAYGQGTTGNTTFYQQVQAVAPPSQYFISVGPDDDQDTFHELSFVWHVDPQEATAAPSANKSYVAFYRDGVEIFKCFRFVPRRSGRVIIGLWPAWWGSNYKPLTFSHVYLKIARLEFVPQADITNLPLPGLITSAAQTYDQEFPVVNDTGNKEVACGFTTPITKREPCTVEGACSSGDSGSHGASVPFAGSGTRPVEPETGLSTGAWVGIALAIVILVVGAILLALYYTGNWKPQKADVAKAPL